MCFILNFPPSEGPRVPEYPAFGSRPSPPGRVRLPETVSTQTLRPLPSRGQVLCPGGLHHDTGEWAETAEKCLEFICQQLGQDGLSL